MFAVQMAKPMDCRVLVLNKYYMAIRITSVRRAFSLLFRQMAEVVSCENGTYANYDFQSWTEISKLKEVFEESPDWISTVNFDIAVPRIIRLLIYDRLPSVRIKFNRRNVYARDKNHCQYCGKKFPLSELSLDHVIPRSLGGQANWENLVCACTGCNAKKGGRTPKQAHMNLVTAPVRPKHNPILHVHLKHQKYKSWKQFINNAYWSVELK